jgi:hypothetical protein
VNAVTDREGGGRLFANVHFPLEPTAHVSASELPEACDFPDPE